MGKIGYHIYRTLTVPLLLLFLVPSFAAPRGAGAAEDSETGLFGNAYESYLDYRPDVAASAFGVFADRFRRSPARDAALYWQAKSLRLIGRTADADEIFGRLLREYPASPFADFARKELENPHAPTVWGTEHKGGEIISGLPGGGPGCEEALRKSGARVKEMEGEAAGSAERALSLREELNKASTELTKTKKERDEAVAALRDAEMKLPEVNDVALRLREREKFQKEQDEYIRKLKEEKSGLLGEIRQRDAKLSDAEKTIASLKGKIAGGSGEKKTVDDAALVKLREAAGDKDKKIDELTAALKEKEKELSGKDELLKQSAGRQSVCDTNAKDLETAKEELKRLREAYEKSETRIARLDEEKRAAGEISRLGGKGKAGTEVKQAAKPNHENAPKKAAAIVRERLSQMDAPVVTISGKTYSAREIGEEGRTAAKVVAKTGVNLSWMKGDPFDDFVSERALDSMATDEDRRRASAETQEYSKKYSLTDEELKALSRVLTAGNVVKRREAESRPAEEELKKYYEDHKEDYLVEKEGRYVKYLVMKYRKDDKLGGVALVSELQREASRGKAFEEIARERRGAVTLRRAEIGALPAWIAEKIRVLKDGEISSIFTEDQFIMLRMKVKAPVYRKYEEVREEIAKQLPPRATGPADVDSWLAALREKAVEAR